MNRIEAALERLADAQARTQEQLTALTARVDALTARVDALAVRVDALAAGLETLTRRVDALAEQMAVLATAMTRLASDVGDLKGDVLELRYRSHLNACFHGVLRRLRLVTDEELGRLADEARQRRVLSEEEAADLLRSDLVALGRRPEDRAEAYLVVEVSAVVDSNNVRRAARRAGLLSHITRLPAVAAVAGNDVPEAARTEARNAGVWCVLDGLASPPTAPS